MATKSSKSIDLVLDVNIWLDFLVIKSDIGSQNYIIRDINSSNYALKIIKPFYKGETNKTSYALNTSNHIISALEIVLKEYYSWSDSEIKEGIKLIESICLKSGGKIDLDYNTALPHVEKVITNKNIFTNSKVIELVDYEDLCVIATAADIARNGSNCFLVTNDTGLLSVSASTLPKLGVAIISSKNLCQFMVS